MTTAARRKSATRRAIRPRIKLWLEFEGEHVFCSGLCQILEGVARTGSIKEAAGEVGKSYRFAWNKIRQAELKLGKKLVDARVGGEGPRRSTLTPLGTQLVAEFLTLRSKLHALVDAATWDAPQMPAR